VSAARGAAGVLLLLAAVACGRARPEVPSPPAGRELVVLVPDPGSDAVGRAVVEAHGTTLLLDRAGAAVESHAGQAVPRAMDAQEQAARFGAVLAAIPPAAEYFDLYFETGDTRLTAASAAMVPAIVAAVGGRPLPDVSVIGHTDTVGRPGANVRLGMRRAQVVERLLVEAGVAATFEVTSHGEHDPLVATRDGVPEPRNRRVQVVVR
jgi:outer membrane protein OmpA-like peptidoglycan-associated protein